MTLRITERRRVSFEEVKTKALCLDCQGELLWTCSTSTTDPPTYPHTCENCGAEQVFGEIYPFVTYQPERLSWWEQLWRVVRGLAPAKLRQGNREDL